VELSGYVKCDLDNTSLVRGCRYSKYMIDMGFKLIVLAEDVLKLIKI
jgi:hypothetical protein